MARTLDNQVFRDLSAPPPPPGVNHHGASPSLPSGSSNMNPGFIVPTLSTTPTPMPPQSGSWMPWQIPQSGSPPSGLNLQLPPSSVNSAQQSQMHSPVHSLPYPGPPSPEDTLTSGMGSLSVSGPSQKSSSEPPALTAPLPTISSLIAALPSVQTPNNTPASKIAWCRDVVGLVDRLYVIPNQTGSADPPRGPSTLLTRSSIGLSKSQSPWSFNTPTPIPFPNNYHPTSLKLSICVPSSSLLVPTPSLYRKIPGWHFATMNGPPVLGLLLRGSSLDVITRILGIPSTPRTVTSAASVTTMKAVSMFVFDHPR